MTPAFRVPAIWLAALLSGGAALAYEICWTRALVVPLGNSLDAAALVLAGFMLGLAMGARLGGDVAERARAPLRVYAGIEVALAAYACVVPDVFALLAGVPRPARELFALALIVVPCLPMGATFPLLVRALTSDASLERRVSIAYGANTGGAAVGAFLAGFQGIAEFGVMGCSRLAATASLGAGFVALSASLGVPRVAPVAAPRAVATTSSRLARATLFATFVSGFAMLGAEVLWARVLTFVFGHDTYAFASLLAIVLGGLALGGLLHRLTVRLDQAHVLAALLALFGVVLLGSFWTAANVVIAQGRDPFGLDATGRLASSLRLELYRELAYTPLLVFLPAALSGAAFPATCSVLGRGLGDPGRRVGVAGLVNGLGGATGAIVAASLLVPRLGIQDSFVALALLSAIASAGIVVLAADPRQLRGSASLAFAPLFGVAVVAAGMPGHLPRRMLLSVVGPRHVRLLHYEEARAGTISVTENQLNGERQLVINAVNEVTTRLVHDQSFKVLGHLGPLLHPAPRRGVMICLGAGVSAGAALTHPLERLDVVDLSEAVQRGARHFADLNRGVLDDPRLHLHIDDGRQFLLNARERYDVAIVDSTHPKAVDSWILYTREFYALVRERLGPDGILVQWLPLHGLSEREFKVIVRTFQEVFPEMMLWANAGFETYGQVAYAKLVGSPAGAIRIDVARVEARLSGQVAADLEPWGLNDPAELIDAFVAGPEMLRLWTNGLPVQTDDHPVVPYTTSLSRGRAMVPALLLAPREPVEPFLEHATPLQLERIADAQDAQGLVLAGELARAQARLPRGRKLSRFAAQRATTLPYYQALAARYPDDVNRLFEAGTQLGTLGHAAAAEPVLRQALTVAPHDFRVALNLALVLRATGRPKEALEVLTALRDESFDAALVHGNLGAALLAEGEPGVAVTHLEAALALDPEALGTRLLLAEARLAQGDLDGAEREARTVLVHESDVAAAHHLLAIVAARRGDCAAASVHTARATRLAPYTLEFYRSLGAENAGCGD